MDAEIIHRHLNALMDFNQTLIKMSYLNSIINNLIPLMIFSPKKNLYDLNKLNNLHVMSHFIIEFFLKFINFLNKIQNFIEFNLNFIL